MKKITYCILSLLALTLSIQSLKAQSFTMKVANKDFENMRYMEAITWYEQILKKDRRNHEAKVKLAECYRKMNDIKNAMRIYSDLAQDENPDAVSVWHYAQALASNEQYEEAAKWYENYAVLLPDDPNGKKFALAMHNINQFYQDSSKYNLKYAASINTWQSEFGPVYVKNGLAFLSNRQQEHAIKHVSEYDESAFLDWYFVTDTAALYTELNKEVVSYIVNTGKNAHDADTYTTSNDTNTPGHYGTAFMFDSVRYHYEKVAKIIRFEDLNKKFHEGPAAVFKSGDTLIMTRNNTYTLAASGKKVSQQALFMTFVKDMKLSSEQILLPFNASSYSSGHPALTPDNKQLYFVSNRPGGKGGTDIYVVAFNKGRWSKPVNVEEVNTSGDEMFPFIDEAGNLYFSSDGRPGLGGLDIFKAPIKKGRIGAITNMGAPFNSSKDDFSITWDKYLKRGFFSSNRKRGFADDDIYSFQQNCQSVVVVAYDSITNLPMDSVKVVAGDMEAYTDRDGRASFCMNPGDNSFKAGKETYEDRTVTSDRREVPMPLSPLHFELAGVVRSEEDKQPMENVNVRLIDASGSTIREITTSRNGSYKFKLDLNSTYTVVAARKNCGLNSVDFTTVGLKRSKVLNGDLTMICIGDIIKIENIYYDLNKFNIRADAQPELNKLAELMWKYPDMRIELRSHTDSRSSYDFNMKLSANRADAAVQYLASKGIIPSRMRAAGYGESLPVNKCRDGVKCSEEQYQMNRRTEFKVLSIR
ncbi:MAG: OmpA family protein [Cyclobacteriaceae bacterium]|nr:OmpA family protein [Cyclobacteriaceae bacterium]